MVAMSRQPWLSSWLFLGNLDHLGRGEETESSHKVGDQQQVTRHGGTTPTAGMRPGNIAISRWSLFVFARRKGKQCLMISGYLHSGLDWPRTGPAT